MSYETTHALLVKGVDHDSCRQRVLNFFARNFLVRYDSVKILTDVSYAADHPSFWPAVEEEIACNRRKVEELIGELRGAGIRDLSDLAAIPQGYESKILHIITHLVDGFFGIDTCFYNLEEDSHGLTEKLRGKIRKKPGEFLLIKVGCSSGDSDSDRLEKIRKFDVSPPQV